MNRMAEAAAYHRRMARTAGEKLRSAITAAWREDMAAVKQLAAQSPSAAMFTMLIEGYFRTRRYPRIAKLAAELCRSARRQTLRELGETEPDEEEQAQFEKGYALGLERRIAGIRKARILKAVGRTDLRSAGEDQEREQIDRGVERLKAENTIFSGMHEGNRIVNAVVRKTYDDCGYESVWNTTIGECELCRRLDGKVIGSDGAVNGMLHPPIHKGCSCSIGPGKKRLILRDVDGNVILELDEFLPEPGSMTTLETRIWYKEHILGIAGMIDRNATIEEQARRACDLRILYRAIARDLMKDQKERKELDKNEPIHDFEWHVTDKMRRKKLNREAAIQDMIETAGKSNAGYDRKAGLEG